MVWKIVPSIHVCAVNAQTSYPQKNKGIFNTTAFSASLWIQRLSTNLIEESIMGAVWGQNLSTYNCQVNFSVLKGDNSTDVGEIILNFLPTYNSIHNLRRFINNNSDIINSTE